ncbi:MAG: hypothetical protein H7039_23900 [Bryobacteraceae bacterium]|nr:hypothetical protein [Bryobacteraceae bacterium]
MTARKAFGLLRAEVTATPLEVRSAYLKRARELHPDLHGDRAVEERADSDANLREVNAAWEYLQDFYELPVVQRRQQLAMGIDGRELFIELSTGALSTGSSTHKAPDSSRSRLQETSRHVPGWILLPVACLPVLGAFLFLHWTAASSRSATPSLQLATTAPPRKVPGPIREEVLQLDRLKIRKEDYALVAEFVAIDEDRRIVVRYRDQTPGDVPASAADLGSLYRVRYRRIDTVGDSSTILDTGYELVRIARLTGGHEAKELAGIPLVQAPRSAIRVLERADLGAIRLCQLQVNDIAGFTMCSLKLVHVLENAGRMDALTANELRYRLKNPGLE